VGCAEPAVLPEGGRRAACDPPADPPPPACPRHPNAETAQRGCGWTFEPAEVEPFVTAVGSAVRVFEEEPDVWRQVQQQGMRRDFGWAKAALQYESVLKDLVAAKLAQQAEAAAAK
jgi:glycogen synthase